MIQDQGIVRHKPLPDCALADSSYWNFQMKLAARKNMSAS